MSNPTPLCPASEIAPGEARDFTLTLEGEELALFVVNHDGNLFAYRNSCPHTGVELNWQPGHFIDLTGHYIQCSLHGALFRFDDGHCVRGPCNGQSLTPLKIVLDNGMITLLTE